MKKRVTILFLLIAVLIFACSCSGGERSEAPSYAGDGWSGGAFEDSSESAGKDTVILEDRKIIKTVSETVETESYDDFIDELRGAVTAAGGYVANSSFTGGGIYSQTANRRASFELRIPADGLDAFVTAVDGLGAVTYYEERVTDVTLNYVDVSSRISVLEAEEQALLSILANASDTSQILAIRDSLTDVQSELASLRGQKQLLDDKIAYSTVHLTLREVKRVKEASPGFFEEVGGNFSESLENIGDGFRGFFVWLIGDSLYILLVCAVLFGVFLLARLAVRRIKVLRANKNAKGEKGESKGDS